MTDYENLSEDAAWALGVINLNGVSTLLRVKSPRVGNLTIIAGNAPVSQEAALAIIAAANARDPLYDYRMLTPNDMVAYLKASPPESDEHLWYFLEDGALCELLGGLDLKIVWSAPERQALLLLKRFPKLPPAWRH